MCCSIAFVGHRKPFAAGTLYLRAEYYYAQAFISSTECGNNGNNGDDVMSTSDVVPFESSSSCKLSMHL